MEIDFKPIFKDERIEKERERRIAADKIAPPSLPEKYRRLHDPVLLEDYGYSFKAADLRQFPEGRKLLLHIILLRRDRDKFNNIMKQLGVTARQSLNKSIMEILDAP